MTRYEVTFQGRENTSIGITYYIKDFVTIPKDTPKDEIDQAVTLETYKRYEHISNLKYKESTK